MNGKHARIWILLSLVVAPLILAGIELFHPAHFTVNPGMSNFLSHPQPHDPQFNAVAYFGPHWWFIMHMIQTPLVVVIAFGMLLLTDTFDAPNPAARGMPVAWVSRLATVIFAIYFTVLDGIGGIGLGRQLIVLNELKDAGKLFPADVEKVKFFLDRMWVDPWSGGVGSFVSLTGSWAVFVAALSAAIYLLLNKRVSWPVLLLLVGFGWELQVGHASFHGPTAFLLLAAAATLILVGTKSGRAKSSAPTAFQAGAK